MRLFICDRFKINSFDFSNNQEDYYTINYYFVDNDSTITETLNFVFENGEWILITDSSLSINLNGVLANKVAIKDYVHYRLSFSDINEIIYLYVLPSFEKYLSYSLGNVTTLTIGKGENNSIIYVDNTFLDTQITISKAKNNNYVVSCADNSNVYSYLNGISFTSSYLKMGDVIFCNGLKIIWMYDFVLINKTNPSVGNVKLIPVDKDSVNNSYFPVTEVEKSVKLFKENSIFFHTPRLKEDIVESKISIDAPPNKSDSKGVPMILTAGSSIIFGLMSCSSAVSAILGLKNGTIDKISAILEFVMCGLMLLISMVFPILTDLWEKNNSRKKERKRQKRYKEYLEKKKKEISDTVFKQESVLKENNLSVGQIVENIGNKQGEIWKRDIFDDDFLSVSLGIGKIPADIVISAPGESFSIDEDNLLDDVLALANDKPFLNNVPVAISMVENRVLPMIISAKFRNDFINSIMLQLMYYYSGKDLKIVIFTNKLNEDRWQYVRFLPHCWDNHYRSRYFASKEDEMIKVSMILEQEYDKRLKFDKNDGSVSDNEGLEYLNFSEYYLIITDDFKIAKDISIIDKIINEDRNLGFSLLIFESSIKNLPSRLDKFVSIDDNGGSIYGRKIEKEKQIQFKADYVSGLDMLSFSQLFSNIPLYGKDVNDVIVPSLTFLDMYSVGMVDQLGILSRWQNNDPVVSLSAVIGVKERNKSVDLDLHEKFHGPHGLIAGSTGSGKSEFIITYILSMAINYHPYEVQFILIDYKGGGLALAFENRETGIKIPHLVGTITNLDTSEMNRTLVSISSELKRRQKIFNATREKLNESTIDIYKYQRFYREGKVDVPMSHLFIISDEFAELKDQQPEFMDELISTARIGRSLGVHLILATQKPSGVVNDQIWSNTRFRICLKVQTVDDSVEMLKCGDAANIKEAGRFYLQVGNDELFELGQSGWAGARYVPVSKITKKINDDILFVDNSGEVIKTVNDEVKKENIVDNGDQLTNIVNYIYNLAIKEKIKFNSLWLPSLANEIYYGNLLKKYQFVPDLLMKNVVIGEYDKPSLQLQGLYQINLAGTNTIIFGIPGSGKENLIITMLFSACINYSPYDIQMYILDFGGGVLKLFNTMPHVGDIIDADSVDKISPLFNFIEDEIKRRKELFADYAGDYISYCKNNPDKKIPLIVIVINAYESFMESTDSNYDDYLSHLLRESSKYGVILVVSVVATNSIRNNVLDCFSNKILLQLQDSFDYVYMLDAPANLVPKKNFGRGIAVIDDDACEFQSALVNIRDEINNYVRTLGSNLLSKYQYKVPAISTENNNSNTEQVKVDNVTFDDMKDYVNTINDIPIGYDKSSGELVKYNFTNSKVTFVVGNSMIYSVSCFGGIIDLIDLVSSVKLFIIDFIDCINFEGNATLVGNNFSQMFDYIIANASNSTNISLYYMIGVGRVNDRLNQEELQKFNMIMSNLNNINNSYFIIADDYDSIVNINNTEWFTKLNISTGIWVGDGIAEQELFKINKINDEDDELMDYAYVINNGEYEIIKIIGFGDDSE